MFKFCSLYSGSTGNSLFVETPNTKILIDGLYKDLGAHFTDIPSEIWQLMKSGKGDLADIDYVLFTHSHYDHYYSPYLRAYLENNKIRGLVLPPLESP